MTEKDSIGHTDEKLVWLGSQSTFSEMLRKKIHKLPELQQLTWEYYSMEDGNIPTFFKNSVYDEAKWLFVDFSQEFDLKRDVLKIISKYSNFSSMKVVAVLDPRDVSFNINLIFDLPISFLIIKKQNIEETLEDMEFFLDPQRVSDEHFKTLGFNYIFWLSFPCKLKMDIKNHKYQVYGNADFFQAASAFKKEMSDYLERKKEEIGEVKFSLEGSLFSTDSLDPDVKREISFSEVVKDDDSASVNSEESVSKLRQWITSPNDQLQFNFSNTHFDRQTQTIVSKPLFKVNSKGGKQEQGSYSFEFEPQESKKIRDFFKNKVEDDTEVSNGKIDVMIFDPEMSLFMSLFKDSEVSKKINMFNCPRFTSNLRLVNDIRPSLIIIDFKIFDYILDVDHTKIDELITLVKAIDDYDPILVILNYDSEKEIADYQNMLRVPFDKNDEFLDQIFQLLIKSKEISYGEEKVDSEVIIKNKGNFHEEIVFVEFPVFVEELTENFCKLKCPFILKEKLNVLEMEKIGSMISLDPFFDTQPDNGVVSGIFTAESENQKQFLRKFVMDLTFSPKTLEQVKELKNFIELNDEKKRQRSQDWKKALAEGVEND